jgi:hypothetical protein
MFFTNKCKVFNKDLNEGKIFPFPNKADADRDELINVQCTSNLALNLLVEMDKNYFNYSKYLKSTIFYALD